MLNKKCHEVEIPEGGELSENVVVKEVRIKAASEEVAVSQE